LAKLFFLSVSEHFVADLAGASDALLAERSADGDEIAFGVLVRRHGPYLRAFAIRLMGSNTDADDAVQDALITAWDRLDSLAEPAKVRSWLTTIVSRKVTDRIRSRRPTGELDVEAPSLAPTPEQRAIATSQLDALDLLLAELPEGQRQCWVLKEVGGYSYDEIAETLGVTPAIVRGRLARARATVVSGMEAWR
jgi:RNA polymerase sigma-70 factor, ECF subfamily